MSGGAGIPWRVFNRSLRHTFERTSLAGRTERPRSWSKQQKCELEELEAVSGWLALKLSVSTIHHYNAEFDAGGPIAAYQRRCKAGQLKPGDPPQEKVLEALDKLFQDLSRRQEPSVVQEWPFRSFWKPPTKEATLQGLYIHGGVGRGKTMLMNLFYDKVKLSKKRRVHFHAFMLDVHERLHKRFVEQSGNSTVDSITVVAEQLMKEALLLCLDEVEVTDVADALILRQLFAVLWPLGMVFVATSNTEPDQLYRGGLNRPLFEPFIKQLKEHCRVYSLDEGQSLDYRRSLSRLEHLYLYPLTDGSEGLLDKGFMILTEGVSGSITQVPVMRGRHIQILAANKVARASFFDLCGGPHGAADYMAIAQRFRALFLDRIPWLGDPVFENEARRFITLIDVLYEANTLFVCSAAVSIDELFQEKPNLDNKAEGLQKVQENLGLHVLGEGGSSGRSTLMVGDMEWSATGRMGASLAKLLGSSSFTRAASARTVSRLLEMQSPAYLTQAGNFSEGILSKIKSAS